VGEHTRCDMALRGGGSPNGQCRVKSGYMWYLNLSVKVTWTRPTYLSINVPRHCFTAWVLRRNRIPVRARLAKFTDITAQYQIYQEENETQEHLFYNCSRIREV